MATTFQTNQFPTRATCWHDEANFLTGTCVTSLVTSTAYVLADYQSTGALNDTFTHSVFLKAGTYTFTVLGVTASNLGQITWSLDGATFITNQDWYSASLTASVTQSGTVTIYRDGYHLVQGQVTAKNASSSGYFAALTKYWFRPTTADALAGTGGTTFQTTQLPTRCTLWHDEANVVAGNALFQSLQTSTQVYGLVVYQNAPAINDTFTHSVFLRGGYYTFSVLGLSASDRGQITWSLDGTPFVTNQDWYTAGTTYNVIKTANILIGTDGYHILQGKTAAKNASSSNYTMSFTKYWFKQASD